MRNGWIRVRQDNHDLSIPHGPVKSKLRCSAIHLPAVNCWNSALSRPERPSRDGSTACAREPWYAAGSIRMLRAFIRLAVRLAREPELHQLRVYHIGTDRMPHLGQGCGELLHAFDTQIKGRMG